MKTILTVIIITLIFNSSCFITFASNEADYYAQYTGSTTASYGYKPNCTFIINKIVGDKFRGSFNVTNISPYNHNENVEGSIYNGEDSFTCVFSFSNYYNTSFSITVYPREGYCECITSGSWHFEDFIMTGTKFSYVQNFGVSEEFDSFSENDMKMCMDLSSSIYAYKGANSTFFSNQVNNYGLKNSDSGLIAYNMLDLDSNNVAFTITYRENEDGSVDMVVIIRGTLNDEWQGNTEITGTSYNPDELVHDNFNKAKNSIKTAIELYYREINNKATNVNLIITGHSRGAAVANLYAKEATDAMATSYDMGIPKFSKVTAYTFACPNVEKFNSTMENYKNIFNFCFKEDLVPTVPLTNPANGWNYWKYGQTCLADLSDANITVSPKAVEEVHNSLKQWDSVNDYYNLPIVGVGLNNIKSTTLFNIASDATKMIKGYSVTPSRIYSSYNFISKAGIYPQLAPLIYSAIKNIDTIGTAHNYTTYNQVINGIEDNETGDDIFCHCSYYDMISSNYLLSTNNSLPESDALVVYDNNSMTILSAFANYQDNATLLGWDIDDPSTWTGITWNESGNVESIDLSYKNLKGTLDLLNFTSLKSLNVSGNNITSINLSGCSALEELDCSFNQLTTLDISDCTKLSSLTCCYNYLDTHEGGTPYNTFDDLMFNDVYVNYYPQSVPANATFNTAELNSLKTFANTNDNNTELDWLDDSGNIDTNKLQNNVLFEYDGSNYRVVAIDLSDLDITGSLNLISLSLLDELYCENTKITSLNVNGCTKLETLKCDGCDITTLILPSNSATKTSPLYNVSCEYNYIDTSAFTSNVINYITFKAGSTLEYINQKGDSSALQAGLAFANTLNENDYSSTSFEPLNDLLEECNNYNYNNLYLNQDDIDGITTELLSAIYDLKAYFNVNISAPNGASTISYDNETSTNEGKYSILYGTQITLNATANEGYTFVGWYDTINNRYLSKNTQYIFKVDSNINLKAVFVADGSSTLTFATYSNWIAGTQTKTTAEWANISSIEDLLPAVPYKYGYSNGRWVYDNEDVLSKLQSGQDVNIAAEYDEDDTSLPTPRVATDTPLLDLYYNYDSTNTVGSFVMAAGFPENIHIESVGMAFYYKRASTFDPTDNFTLLLNNKMLVSRFNTDVLNDIYITNMHKMTSTYNWAARGYVTYYDADNNLVTTYSNQINVIDTNQVF